MLLVGHSIGVWFIQEVLKARASLCPRVGAYMLFPTLSDIAKTPDGRMLWVDALVLKMVSELYDPEVDKDLCLTEARSIDGRRRRPPLTKSSSAGF